MVKRALRYALYGLLALPVLLPLWLMFSGSFMGADEVVASFGDALSGGDVMARWPLIPRYPTLRPYVELLLDSPEFFAMFWNSALYAAATLLGQLLTAAPAAWAFARFRFRGKKTLFALYIALMLMPFQVTLVAQYLSLDAMHLLDTRLGIILPAVFATFPVFIMVKYFAAIPESMLEAAALDGAGAIRVFASIGVPMGLPGILAAMVLGFFEAWSMIEQPMTLLKTPSLWPLSLYLPRITADSLGKSLSASCIALLPALLIFLYGQQYLEQGIHAMGIKE